jgi:tRNA dimethylallyltransferase
MRPKLIIILGPTAVGKTDYSIELAQKYASPIISCDSRQLFREMIVGTAPPSIEQLALVPHYFIQSHTVKEYYTAGRYELEALELMDKLFKKHDNLIMVGGAGLYIDAVCKGLDDFPDADQKLRQILTERLEKDGLESLKIELKKIDPQSYETIDIANKQRVIRALEVTIATGKKFSSYKKNQKKERFFDIEKVGITRERNDLYDRINLRVDRMMEAGLVEEVRSLVDYRNMPALNTVGYKEIFDYLDEKISLEEAVSLIKRNTRRYAKRQMTYWGRDDEIAWITL